MQECTPKVVHLNLDEDKAWIWRGYFNLRIIVENQLFGSYSFMTNHDNILNFIVDLSIFGYQMANEI